MRFTAAGALDPTWNNGALVRTSFTGSTGDQVIAVATSQQIDGRSAIGDHSPGSDIALIRYSLTGGGGGNDFGDGTGKSLVNLGASRSSAMEPCCRATRSWRLARRINTTSSRA
jgi:hypothetical protein